MGPAYLQDPRGQYNALRVLLSAIQARREHAPQHPRSALRAASTRHTQLALPGCQCLRADLPSLFAPRLRVYLQAPALAVRKPALFEQCLELVYDLSASPDTGGVGGWVVGWVGGWVGGVRVGGVRVVSSYTHVCGAGVGACEAGPTAGSACMRQPTHAHRSLPSSCLAGTAMLDLLRGYYSMLAPLLDSVACAPLPEGAVQRASSLHQRAWLLQVGGGLPGGPPRGWEAW